jgi:energy-coupling factor transporter ATP-binding protein EcfA2
MAAGFRLGGLLPMVVEHKLDKWIDESKSVNIFITGKTGTGKTSLVNSLVGTMVSQEGRSLDPGTTNASRYRYKLGEITVNVWDTPGLQDGTGQEAEYVRDIIRRWKKIDLFIYCVRMSETRFVSGNPDIISMRLLNEALGSSIWKSALLVLTFANDVVNLGTTQRLQDEALEEYFEGKVEDWKDRLHLALQEEIGVPEVIVESIDVVPAGYHRRLQLLPNGECWMSRLWLKALAACSSRAQPAFIKINEHRLKNANTVDQSHHSVQNEFLRDRPLIIAAKGEEIGAALGCPRIGYTTGFFSGLRSNFEFTVQQLLLLVLALRNKIIDHHHHSSQVIDHHSSQTTSRMQPVSSSGPGVRVPSSSCASCGKNSAELKKCSACKKTKYCDRTCQKKDWKKHKKVCTFLSQAQFCNGCEKYFHTSRSCPCHTVAYCSKPCQRMDWYRHKPDCTFITTKK